MTPTHESYLQTTPSTSMERMKTGLTYSKEVRKAAAKKYGD
jgi:hypothetical protein